MQRYLFRRLLLSVPVLFGLSLAIFGSIRLVPGDVVVSMTADAGNVPPEQRAALRHQLGLDRPFVVQYVKWIGGVAHGDFGNSLWRGTSVRGELRGALPGAIELTLVSFLVGGLIAIPGGGGWGVRPGTRLGYGGRAVRL